MTFDLARRYGANQDKWRWGEAHVARLPHPELHGGKIQKSDFSPLPCSHPHCASVGYLLRDDAGAWRSLVALVGAERLRENLGLVANRVADDGVPRALRPAVRESLLGLLSEQSSLSHPTVGDLWRDVCESCDLGIGTLRRKGRTAWTAVSRAPTPSATSSSRCGTDRCSGSS